MQLHRLAVWGDPIAHSKSPELHVAAYDVLGLEWQYDRRRVNGEEFAAAYASLDSSWRGLSLTMPLKEAAFRAAATRDRHAEATGAVNTLLLGEEPRGFNTDVGGIIDSLHDAGIHTADRVRILGAGATAASALVAASELGVAAAEVRARRPDRAAELIALGERIGVPVSVLPFNAATAAVDLTVATLPSGTVLDSDQLAHLSDTGGALLDAAYAPWPSALAAAWSDARVISGFEMLLNQAVRQIRIFLHADPLHVLDREDAVRQAMRTAAGV